MQKHSHVMAQRNNLDLLCYAMQQLHSLYIIIQGTALDRVVQCNAKAHMLC
jgi:hypothetical protein